MVVAQIPSVEGYEPGQQLNYAEIFKVGDIVDIAGTTIGKGFQGVHDLKFSQGAFLEWVPQKGVFWQRYRECPALSDFSSRT